MSVFTDAELRYLTGGRQLGRIATVGVDGTPHVVSIHPQQIVSWGLESGRGARTVAS